MDYREQLNQFSMRRATLYLELFRWTHENLPEQITLPVARALEAAIRSVEDAIEAVKKLEQEQQKRQEPTPMTKQYFDLKQKHPDAILLFRCGDFYETYNIDAYETSEILGITLTWRTSQCPRNHKTYEGAMAGFPYHALDTYLPKLIRAGKRVAICDQLEQPKKFVKRGITEMVSPGIANQ